MSNDARGSQVAQGWDGPLERYRQHAAEKVTPATLRARMGRLRRLALDLGGTPDDVTPERFDSWAAQLPCAVSTAGEYVQAARAFYRWAIRAGAASDSPVASPAPGVRYRMDDRWADAVTTFERAQDAAGMAPGTIRRRLQHLRRFGVSIGIAPWHVHDDDYGAWIARQRVTDTQRAALRDSLRAFYRWAHDSGRIAADPTAEPNRRARKLGTPAAWEAELSAWRRWMIGSGTAPASVRTRMDQLENFARAHRSAGPFDMTTDDVFDYLSGKQWARETRRGFRVAVRAFYRWAVDTGRTAENPAELMPRVKSGDPSRIPATDAEYRAALAAARDDRWRLALRLSCELGLRRTEVAQIHASDMRPDDSGRAWLTVHGKGGRVRRLPVPPNLAAAIARAGDGHLFPAREGGHTTPAHVGKQVSALLPPGVTMHALRHAFATRAYNVNRDVFTVQRLLGHASAATTQRYVQVSDDSMRALVEAVAL